MEEIDLRNNKNDVSSNPAGESLETLGSNADQAVPRPPTLSTVIMKATFTLLLLVMTSFFWYHGLFKGSINLFSCHLICMSTGYLILMYQAILVFSDPWRPAEYPAKVTLHWILQAAALVCAIFGFAAIYTNKIVLEKKHFHTLHGNWGLYTYIGSFLVITGGIWTKYSFQLRQYVKPIYPKIVHSLFGVVVYVMAIVTISLALWSKWWDRNVASDTLRIIFLLILWTSTVFLLCNPVITCGKRFKTAFLGAKI